MRVVVVAVGGAERELEDVHLGRELRRQEDGNLHHHGVILVHLHRGGGGAVKRRGERREVRKSARAG